MVYNSKELQNLFNLNKDYLCEIRKEIEDKKSQFHKLEYGLQRSIFSQYMALNLYLDNLGLTLSFLKEKEKDGGAK